MIMKDVCYIYSPEKSENGETLSMDIINAPF
jgi:hypothetical protein